MESIVDCGCCFVDSMLTCRLILSDDIVVVRVVVIAVVVVAVVVVVALVVVLVAAAVVFAKLSLLIHAPLFSSSGSSSLSETICTFSDFSERIN